MAKREREEEEGITDVFSVSQPVSSCEGEPMKKFSFDKFKKNVACTYLHKFAILTILTVIFFFFFYTIHKEIMQE